MIASLEIIFFTLFLAVVFRLIKRGGRKEALIFVLPILVFYFFIEAFWIYKGEGGYNSGFHFMFKGVPLIVLLSWVFVVFASIKLTQFFSGRGKIPEKRKILLSLGDASWSVLLAFLVLEPLAFKFQLWYHICKTSFLFGAPLWYFAGWFLSVFIISLGYRLFRRFSFWKRAILAFAYIFSIIALRILINNF